MNESKRQRLVNRELKGIYSHLNILLDDTLVSLSRMKSTLIYFKLRNKKISKEEMLYLNKFIVDIEEISNTTENVLNNVDEIPHRDSLVLKLESVKKEFRTCKTCIDVAM